MKMSSESSHTLRTLRSASAKLSYLASRDKLQRSQGGPQILGIALQVEESASDSSLQLGGVLPRRRIGGDLVDGSHDCRQSDKIADCAARIGAAGSRRRVGRQRRENGIVVGKSQNRPIFAVGSESRTGSLRGVRACL